MKIWINSCHASLEYDQVKMFQQIPGLEISGLFHVASTQRPKIAGITDYDPPGEVHEANKTINLTRAHMNNPDIVLVHQWPDFPQRAETFAKMGIPSIAILFGQGSPEQHAELARIAREQKNIWLVAYALKEFSMYARLGAPLDRLRLIRFAKDPTEFNPDAWSGNDKVCLIPCNSLHRRGACGWNLVQILVAMKLPILICGLETEAVGGLGEISWAQYRQLLTRVRCCLSVGTIPAPYTLSLLEAICSGTPIVANDNGYGLSVEGLNLSTGKTAEELYALINDVLTRDDIAKNRHEHSVYLSRAFFSWEQAKRQWTQLFANIMGQEL